MFAAVPTASLFGVNSSSECFKCGTTKRTGKLSCCAHGGAWFKNCGDAGDTAFDHTWAEGIQACKSYVSAVSVEPPLQAVLHHAGNNNHPTNTAESEKGSPQQTRSHPPDSIFDASDRNFRDCVQIVQVLACICVMCIVSPVRL